MGRKKADLPARYRVSRGDKFRLKDVDPGETGDLKSKEDATDLLDEGVAALCDMQEKLYAQSEWSVLLIFQAMDAAGKDGTIKHVLSGVNPQGCEVTGFRAPSESELGHDFLWRASLALPERGRIGVFNRSYYEEVLVVRVHPEYLEKQKIPAKLVTKQIWRERFQSIVDFERHLARSGTEFNVDDLAERKLWARYQEAYEEMVQETATDETPWYVIPADHKWFARLVVSSVIVDKLRSLGLHVPELSTNEKTLLTTARAELAADGSK
ncbi:MAG: polyphosphate kinase 2 family protein [Verrucomicrobiota bacterium]|nr:polyphosphate kinase 2 family protein [Verrucomicrobiota bacterium]